MGSGRREAGDEGPIAGEEVERCELGRGGEAERVVMEEHRLAAADRHLVEEEADRPAARVGTVMGVEERADMRTEREFLPELAGECCSRRLPGADLAPRKLPGPRPGPARRAPADEVAIPPADDGGHDRERGSRGSGLCGFIGSRITHGATAYVNSLVLCLALASGSARAADKMDFWTEPQAGANFSNRAERAERLVAARAYGVGWIRLAPDKWASAEREFLLGDCDAFTGPVTADLERLAAVVDQADSLGLRVVIALRSLPGARWRDPHAQAAADTAESAAPADSIAATDPLAAGDRPRLWLDDRYQEQSAALWGAIAARFRDHRAVVGYDLAAAPAPEPAGTAGADLAAFCAAARGTPADIDRFYARLVAAVRAVDRTTPILLAAGLGASPAGFHCLTPIADERVLYAFHMYEPRAYTDRRLNRGRYRYPGSFPGVEGTADSLRLLDREALLELLAPVIRWQSAHRIPSNRIVVAELGVHRQVKGASAYLADLLRSCEDVGWHWAFFAFREDTWPGMDYELGTRPVSAATWRALRRGEDPPLARGPNPLFDVIRRRLAPPR